MNITWKIVETDYYLSKNEKEKVIFSTEYYVLAEKNGFKKQITNKINFDLEIIKAVEAKDAVLYTDKEDDITAQIDAQLNPPAATKGSGVPW
jgi:hypothetical protein